MAYQININLIKQKRLEKGYTLQEMATFLGLKGRTEYYKREHGDTRFTSVELPVLSKKLGISMNRFFIKKIENIATK